MNPVLSAYIERNLTIAEMVAEGHELSTVRRAVELVNRSEYKRRQSPPGIKITPLAFGKDRRLPITNHFKEECE